MRDVLASINSTRWLDEILDMVLAQAAELLGCHATHRPPDTRWRGHPPVLTVRASRDLQPEIVSSRLPLESTIAGIAIKDGRPVAIPDLADVEAPPVSTRIARLYRAVIATPLAVRGGIQGAITLRFRQPRQFSPDDIGLVQAFADQTALAMENARLHAQTRRRSRDLEALYRADDVLRSAPCIRATAAVAPGLARGPAS